MFDIGFSELIVIALVALIVLGPKRLPEVARTAGRWAAQARRFMNTVKADFEREMSASEELRHLQQEIAETRNLMEAPAETLFEKPSPPEPAPVPGTAPALEAPSTIASPVPAIEQKPVEQKPAVEQKRARKPRTQKKPIPDSDPKALSLESMTQAEAPAAKPKATRKKHGGTKRTAG